MSQLPAVRTVMTKSTVAFRTLYRVWVFSDMLVSFQGSMISGSEGNERQPR